MTAVLPLLGLIQQEVSFTVLCINELKLEVHLLNMMFPSIHPSIHLLLVSVCFLLGMKIHSVKCNPKMLRDNFIS